MAKKPYRPEFRTRNDLVPSDEVYRSLNAKNKFSLRAFREDLLKTAQRGDDLYLTVILRELLKYEEVKRVFRRKGFDVDGLIRGIGHEDLTHREHEKRTLRRRKKNGGVREIDGPEDDPKEILATREENVHTFIDSIKRRSVAMGINELGAVAILKTLLANENDPHGNCGVAAFGPLGITPAKLFPKLAGPSQDAPDPEAEAEKNADILARAFKRQFIQPDAQEPEDDSARHRNRVGRRKPPTKRGDTDDHSHHKKNDDDKKGRGRN